MTKKKRLKIKLKRNSKFRKQKGDKSRINKGYRRNSKEKNNNNAQD